MGRTISPNPLDATIYDADLDTHVDRAERIQVSSNDTTPDYIENKLTDTGSVTWAVTSEGGNEKLEATTSLAAAADAIEMDVKNTTGSTLLKGKVVYFSGFDAPSGFPKVTLAKGDSATTMPSAGFIKADILDNASGKIISPGKLTGLDTSSFSVGDELFVSATTAGEVQNTRPTGATSLIQKVAEVLKVDASTGIIEVFGANRVNASPNLADGSFLLGDSSGLPVETDFSTQVLATPMAKIGTPTFETIQEFANFALSTGLINNGGGAITDAGGATIDVSAGAGFIKATDSDIAEILFFDWSAASAITIPSNTTRFVGVEYNAGSPQIFIKSADSWDFDTEFPLGAVVNEGGVLHIVDNPWKTADAMTDVIERFYGQMPVERDNRLGGLILSETGTRNIAVTAGKLWDKANEFDITAIDTSVAGSFDRYYRDGSGGFTKQAAQTQWNNTQYDDGDGTLGTMTAGFYANQWFYVSLEDDLLSMYGTNEYASEAEALNEGPPSAVPDRIMEYGRLVGRVVFLKSAASATVVQSAFGVAFTAAVVSDHNNLANVQGGAAGEKFHITGDFNDALAGTSGAPSTSNKYVTNDDTSASGSGAKVPRGTAGVLADSWISVGSVTQHVASIDHDLLLNFAAGEHFLQSAITTVGTVTVGNVDAVVSAASLTLAGKVELTTTAEIDTGTDSTRAMPIDQYVASDRNIRFIELRLIESDTSVTTGTSIRGDYRVPFAGTIIQLDGDAEFFSAYNDTAGITGTMIVDVHKNGTTIMTTNKLDIETTEKSTATAATQPDLTTTAVVAGDILTFDVDTIHSGTAAKGLSVRIPIRMT